MAQAPTQGAAQPKTNRLGLTFQDYQGGKSTLCLGCGHDAITGQITRAFYEMGVEPHNVIKLSGIGCSSKTPAYFLNRAHGFNSVHGRMPAIATGAMLANKNLTAIGVSGDGDTASIGMGQFVHMVRRNVPVIYIIEDNGVYGLTKGQFSATADVGSTLKTGVANDLPPIDLCALAIQLGCGYVARSFSGDMKQMVPLLQGAIAHKGTAVIDVISPCVTFNNHEGSTKSYDYAKKSEEPIHEVGFVPAYENITVDYEPGTMTDVTLHDGSRITLKKLETDYDPTNKEQAMMTLLRAHANHQFLTGLIYAEPQKPDFLTTLNLVDQPLATLPQGKTRPSKESLDKIMDSLR